MGRTDCISLFACVLLLCSSTECSITFSIAPSQKTQFIPKKQQPEVANPPAAVLACVIGFSKQVCCYPTVLAFKTKTAAKESALDLCYRGEIKTAQTSWDGRIPTQAPSGPNSSKKLPINSLDFSSHF